MVEKEEISQLFEDDLFKKTSIYFYRKPMSGTEVIEKSDVSRGTLYRNFLAPFKTGKGEYDDEYLRVHHKVKSKPYQFTQKLLTDWISYDLNLTKQEEKALCKIVNKEAIDKVLREDSESWLDVKTKLMLPFSFFQLSSTQFGTGEKFYVKKMPNDISIYSNLPKKDFDEYLLAFQKIIHDLDDEVKEGLSKKFMESKYSISLTINDLTGLALELTKELGNQILDLLKPLGNTRQGKRALKEIEKDLKERFGIESID